MNNKIFIKPDKFSLSRLLEEVKKGRIQVPVFYRDFIWTQKQIFDLCESISEGYPIGSFLFWNPGVTYETKNDIAGYIINETTKNKEPLYILDGFQRISTIFGVLYDFETKNKKFEVYYDLIEKYFTLQKNPTKNNPNGLFMPLHIVLDTLKYLEFIREIDTRITETERNELINSIQFIVNAFRNYEIAYTEIIGGDISSAINIFYRINYKDTEVVVSKDAMISALSYNKSSNFTLSQKLDDLLNIIEPYNFYSLKRDIILNCISPPDKVFFDTNLEDLIKPSSQATPNLESLCEPAFEALTKTIDFLYNEMKIIHFSLLPYPNQLIFISNYFKVCPTPTEAQINTLKNWVWVSSYANYFTIYSLSQQREAYNEFMKFAKNSTDSITGIYDAYNQFRTAKFPSKIFFGSVRSKNLQLFMLQKIYADQKPVLNETYKQIPIFDKKNKQPANIIVCASADLSKLQNVAKFFETTTSNAKLENFFLNEELRDLYLNKDIETFLIKRKQIIQDAEEEFVKSLGAGIVYDRESSTIDEPDN